MKEGHAMNGRENAGNQGGNLGETWNEGWECIESGCKCKEW